MKYAKDYAEDCYEHIKNFDLQSKEIIVSAIELAILRRLEDYKNKVYFPLLEENKLLKNLVHIAGEDLKAGEIVTLSDNKVYKGIK
jgi:hypothetical protein